MYWLYCRFLLVGPDQHGMYCNGCTVLAGVQIWPMYVDIWHVVHRWRKYCFKCQYASIYSNAVLFYALSTRWLVPVVLLALQQCGGPITPKHEQPGVAASFCKQLQVDPHCRECVCFQLNCSVYFCLFLVVKKRLREMLASILVVFRLRIHNASTEFSCCSFEFLALTWTMAMSVHTHCHSCLMHGPALFLLCRWLNLDRWFSCVLLYVFWVCTVYLPYYTFIAP